MEFGLRFFYVVGYGSFGFPSCGYSYRSFGELGFEV